MTALSHERDEAFALTEEGLRLTRLGNLILRDGMLTAAEQDAREIALIECYDKCVCGHTVASHRAGMWGACDYECGCQEVRRDR